MDFFFRRAVFVVCVAVLWLLPPNCMFLSLKRMLKALAQFAGSIQSYNAKYDKVKRGEDSFTISEKYGYNVFKAKCNTCHKEPLFTDNSFRNNGLTINKNLADIGRMRITGKQQDSLKFKVPSLRNIAKTAPYMHDGSLKTLKEVVDFYVGGGNANPHLDREIKALSHLTKEEREDLVSFMESLTGELPK